MLIYVQAWHQTQKPVVATPCQSYSDLWPQKSGQGKPLEGIKT